MVKRNTQSGFGIIGIVIVIVVLGLIGGLGWVAYKNFVQKPSNATHSTSSSGTNKSSASVTTVNPYAGWKTATLANEHITYQYPADWTVTDRSMSTPKGTGCVYPGIDDVILTSSSQHQVALMTGVECIGTTGAKTFDSMPITTLGQNLSVTFAAPTSGEATNPTSACLSPTANQTQYPAGLKSKNIFVNSGSDVPFNDFCYKPYAYYTNPNATDPKLSATDIKNSADFATAKLIFESMKYTAN